MRLFVGIPLEAAVIDELSAISARLRSRQDGLRWAAPESWHITLQFLGNASPEQYLCLAARLNELRSPPVPIRLDALDFFDRAGIFNASVRLSPELLTLQERVVVATAQCGYPAETRPYQPHITLARGKREGRGEGFRELKNKIPRQPAFTRFVTEEFLLYESLLSPSGSRYEVRHRFQLGSHLPI
ncbi:MAG TPA: RNA 2',3'-cyclic phosphodiesterase [Terracidiphilus sp.]|nr:RNA 2',3'-cyclic phosphodiesterase [Terracidiphilus sp.]